MKTATFCIILCATLFAAGCASNNKPIIDPAGVDMGLYQHDLAECEQVAEQVNSKAGAGAAGGAVVGGLIGAIFGGSDGAVKGAGAGAVSGGAKGVGATAQEKSKVVKNCLRHRGYQVLN
jgi:hypothetical protein